jgi:hypothetical protein
MLYRLGKSTVKIWCQATRFPNCASFLFHSIFSAIGKLRSLSPYFDAPTFNSFTTPKVPAAIPGVTMGSGSIVTAEAVSEAPKPGPWQMIHRAKQAS